jgi:glycolate oxidase FAD binding subunit
VSLLEDLAPAEAVGLPAAGMALAPATLEEAASLLEHATEHGHSVLIWGGGTHQGIGEPVFPDLVLSTERLDAVVAWEPDDMTIVVEPGARVADLDERLAARNQTLVGPEHPGDATIGGIVATGVSGYRRYRYGPTRDRVLEATLVTGDGRIVTGGGRVVKNVTGYDLPRLATGSLGALGLIGRICLKLWPLPKAAATVSIDDPEAVLRTAYRPLAVLGSNAGAILYLGGTPEEVAGQAKVVGGEPVDGLHWPEPPTGQLVLSLRVPPREVAAAVGRLEPGWQYIAQYGVGEITVALDGDGVEPLEALRSWAESVGGGLVTVAAPLEFHDRFNPWGTPPPSLAIQRRLVARFDPARVINPGRLPGGL